MPPRASPGWSRFFDPPIIYHALEKNPITFIFASIVFSSTNPSLLIECIVWAYVRSGPITGHTSKISMLRSKTRAQKILTFCSFYKPDPILSLNPKPGPKTRAEIYNSKFIRLKNRWQWKR